MKVLMINGSPRNDGNTSIALNEIGKALKENGIDYEIVQIGNKIVRGCVACGGCANIWVSIRLKPTPLAIIITIAPCWKR